MNTTQEKEEMSIQNLKNVMTSLDGAKELTLPKMPESILCLKFLEREFVSQETSYNSKNPVPFADSEIVSMQLVNSRRLTKDSEVKKTIELTLEFCEKEIAYQPGDAFGFLCHNSSSEVSELLGRLGLSQVADVPYEITLNKELNLKKKIPSHIPVFSTLRQIFTSYIDIRAVPKKVLLRVLSNFCTDESEQQTLQFLCSREGSIYYTQLLMEKMMSILDILMMYGSCTPPVEFLIEYLPPLKPRFYSVSSSPLVSNQRFQVVFNVIEVEKSDGRYEFRKGVCTGWFEHLSNDRISPQKRIEKCHNGSLNDLTKSMSEIALTPLDVKASPKILVYKRKNDHFHLPDDPGISIIMIGPGTGVAPFIGFLQHRKECLKEDDKGTIYGDMWLIYGCRYREKDFLFRKELEDFVNCKVLSKLFTCFSRDDPCGKVRYVQDIIRQQSEPIVKALESGAVVYVCGDARNMAKDVRQTFIQVIKEVKELSTEDAETFMKNLEKEGRYCVDAWT